MSGLIDKELASITFAQLGDLVGEESHRGRGEEHTGDAGDYVAENWDAIRPEDDFLRRAYFERQHKLRGEHDVVAQANQDQGRGGAGLGICGAIIG